MKILDKIQKFMGELDEAIMRSKKNRIFRLKYEIKRAKELMRFARANLKQPDIKRDKKMQDSQLKAFKKAQAEWKKLVVQLKQEVEKEW